MSWKHWCSSRPHPRRVLGGVGHRRPLLVSLGEVYPVTTTKDVAEVHDAHEIQAMFVEEALAAYDAKEDDVIGRDLEWSSC